MAARPSVVTTTPKNYATDIPISTSLTVEFDADMDPRYLQDFITLADANNARIEGRITYRKKTATFTPLAPLNKGTTYVFTITGDNNLGDDTVDGVRNILGDSLAGTRIIRFTTETTDMIPAPTVTSPVQNTILSSTPVVFAWEPVDNASEYEIEISKSNTFTPLVYPIIPTYISVTTLTPDVEMEDGIYYWRLRAANGTAEKGPWTPTMQFNVSTLIKGPISPGDVSSGDIADSLEEAITELEQIESFPQELQNFVPENVKHLYFRFIGDIDLSEVDGEMVTLEGFHITGDPEEESHGPVEGKVTIIRGSDFTTYVLFTPKPLVDESPIEDDANTETEVTA